MGARKGTPKPIGAGRKKGVANKRSDSASETLDALGFNALAEMYRTWADPLTSEGIRAKMLVEMAQYQFPKRKALEHSGEVKELCTLTIIGV